MAQLLYIILHYFTLILLINMLIYEIKIFDQTYNISEIITVQKNEEYWFHNNFLLNIVL